MLKITKQKVVTLFLLLLSLTIIISSWKYRLNPLESFSLQFNDINFQIEKKTPNKNVLFIAVDEPSVNKFGRWPFDRRKVAKVILNLQEADAVIMDMIFSEKSTPAEDATLAHALESTNSICGFFLRHNATQFISDEQEEILSDSALDMLHITSQKLHSPQFVSTENAEMNIDEIMNSCSMSATFSTFRDKDQLFRSYPTAYYYRENLYPSLGIQALRLHFNSDIESLGNDTLTLHGKNFSVNDNGFVRLNYYPKESYKTLSFKDVYEGKYSSSFFKNKIVILGISDVGATDVRATPIGTLNGPLLHYTFISNFLNSELISEKPLYTLLLILGLFLTTLIIANSFKSIAKRLSLYLTTYFLVYVISKYLFIKDTLYIDMFYPLLTMLFSASILEIYIFVTKESESKFIRDAFSSYLSSDLLHELIENPQSIKLGGELKEMSILFSDVRSFTSISEKMPPEQLIQVMNRYFTPMTDAVLNNSGMLDKYIGDAVMAFYNAPINLKEHANAACQSALDMIDALEKLNKEFAKENLPHFSIGVGINTAEVIVGNMGSKQRFNYTVVGDGVNLASRVEGLNKNYGTSILITEFTQKLIDSSFLTRRLEAVKVKGKDEAVMLYELMKDTPENRALKKEFETILTIYENGNHKEAQEKFLQLYKKSNDKVSYIFYENLYIIT